MRVINKKYLLVILLVGIILTCVIILKPKEKVKLDNVILKQEVNNKTFAMYKEEGNEYVPVEDNKFPEMYVLNLTESKCIDNNGNELNGVLSYENGNVTITSGITTYCYLYFDKTLGAEIFETNDISSHGLKTDKERGAMYRFQGQQSEGINNYICFGTNVKDVCTSDTDHYMYRIIGIEASTGRVKVIKKEALEQGIQWYINNDTDIEFPQSKIYEAIKGTSFLENPAYVPEGWKEKISDNTWLYGDMFSNNTLGAKQTGKELYLIETGQKGTIWDEKANAGDPGAKSAVVDDKSDSSLHGQPVYYIRHENEKWDKTFTGKVSLMYLHDYNYSVSDTANCELYVENYEICQTGWLHLSQNDVEHKVSEGEWTMSRFGWDNFSGFFLGHYVNPMGFNKDYPMAAFLFVRPVFYINASQQLKSGTGTLEDPFIIKS